MNLTEEQQDIINPVIIFLDTNVKIRDVNKYNTFWLDVPKNYNEIISNVNHICDFLGCGIVWIDKHTDIITIWKDNPDIDGEDPLYCVHLYLK